MKGRIVNRLSDSISIYFKKVINLSDSPKRIASGVALGFAFDFLPIPIISIPLSYMVARLIRCNPIATVLTVVFFKITVPFFYTLDYITGNILFGDIPGPDAFNTGIPILDTFFDMLFEHGYPFLAGCLINATLAWLVVYFILLFLLDRKLRRNDT